MVYICAVVKQNEIRKGMSGDKMTKEVRFTKMHGAGNDYIYVNSEFFPLDNPEELAVKWSAFHTGVGADGLVLIGPSEIADFSMRIFNADGSEAMMCGNATRCIGKYVYEEGLTKKNEISLETLSGIKYLKLTIEDKVVSQVTVDMGMPEIGELDLGLLASGEVYTGTVISMGNPHFVIFVNEIEKVDLKAIGPVLEQHAFFSDRTNVEFAEVVAPNEIRMRVWERGSGITQACGTGACATVVAGVLTGKTGRETHIIMDGGSLLIRWDKETGKVFMTGGATRVFEGTIQL